MKIVDEYLTEAAETGASDVLIVPGTPVSVRCNGEIRQLDDDIVTAKSSESIIRRIYDLAERNFHKPEGADIDFSFAMSGVARFRVNIFCQRQSLACVARIIRFNIPDPDDIGIPDVVMQLSNELHGMVLITGTAGSGKSTTQACLIDRINRTRHSHVITLEDPIEFLHRNDRSIISQREIPIDIADHSAALISALRQSPDVILLGEMRSHATISTAITAAETGHLIIGTLHTRGAENAVNRIIDSFPADQQEQVRKQLSGVLTAVVSQQLLPSADGHGMVPAFEVVCVSPAIRTLIRDDKMHQIMANVAQSRDGRSVAMDRYIEDLVRDGKITADTARLYAMEPGRLSI